MATYPLNPGDIVELSIRGNVLAQTTITVLHYQATLSGPIADGIGALTTAETAFSAGGASPLGNFRACCASNWSSDFVRLQVVYPTRRPYLQVVRSGPGSRAGNCETPNICAYLNLQASHAGRGRHGGTHFPALSISDFTSGLISNALGAAIAAWPPVWLLGLSISAGNSLTPVIWSKVKPTEPSEILGTSVGGTVRTMHRRTVGLGI